jgi:ketosteroid isomerase-like protein
MRALVLIGVITMIAMSASPSRAADEAALDSLVANERAFAALSVAKGMKVAFLTYLAEDAVLFRPRAVNGRKDWEAKPASTATLLWEPAFAAVSSAGDMGYSTGPWEFHPPADSAGTPAPPEYFLYGQFNSVWKKEKGTGWRVVADIGVTHAKPRAGVGKGDFTPGPTLKLRTMKSGRANIPEQDQKLSKAMRSAGARDALASHAASDLRVNSEGRMPAVGLEAAQARFDTLGGFYEYRTEGSGIARSGDLGFSYGLAEHFLSAKAAPADTGVFLHVWRQEGGRFWRLALAVINPLTRR